MNYTILVIAFRYIRFILVFFSILTLFRGHNLPGGGFIGGLMASGAFIFQALALGVQSSKNSLRIKPSKLIASGLFLAILSTLPGFFVKGAFFAGTWVKIPLLFGATLKLGTPLLFDTGVYLSVTGVVLLFIFTLMEEWEWN